MKRATDKSQRAARMQRKSRRAAPKGATRAVAREAVAIDWQRGLRIGGFVVLALLVVIASLNAVRELRSVEVGEVLITGYSGVGQDISSGASEKDLTKLMQDLLSEGFWQLDLHQLQAALESHPWVRTAVIRREWPNRLVIGIDEYVAVARWNDESLLSASGEVFTPSNAKTYTHLPLFVVQSPIAPDQQQAGQAQIRRAVDWFNRFQKPLAAHDLSIRELASIEAGDFTLLLSNGMRLKLGAENIEQRFERFLNLLEGALTGKLQSVEVADLRYANGASITWRTIDTVFDDSLEFALAD